MKRTIKYLSLAVALLAAGSASAYNHDFGKGKSGIVERPVSQTRGANCAPANFRLTMAFNDVMTAIADIGGHIKQIGEPGWLVLGRGYEEFARAEVVWRAALAHAATK